MKLQEKINLLHKKTLEAFKLKKEANSVIRDCQIAYEELKKHTEDNRKMYDMLSECEKMLRNYIGNDKESKGSPDLIVAHESLKKLIEKESYTYDKELFDDIDKWLSGKKGYL